MSQVWQHANGCTEWDDKVQRVRQSVRSGTAIGCAVRHSVTEKLSTQLRRKHELLAETFFRLAEIGFTASAASVTGRQAARSASSEDASNYRNACFQHCRREIERSNLASEDRHTRRERSCNTRDGRWHHHTWRSRIVGGIWLLWTNPRIRNRWTRLGDSICRQACPRVSDEHEASVCKVRFSSRTASTKFYGEQSGRKPRQNHSRTGPRRG